MLDRRNFLSVAAAMAGAMALDPRLFAQGSPPTPKMPDAGLFSQN